MFPLHLQITECHFAAVVSVEPTNCYYEKMSDELKKIVNEVKEKEEEKPLSDGEKQLLLMLIKAALRHEKNINHTPADQQFVKVQASVGYL